MRYGIRHLRVIWLAAVVCALLAPGAACAAKRNLKDLNPIDKEVYMKTMPKIEFVQVIDPSKLTLSIFANPYKFQVSTQSHKICICILNCMSQDNEPMFTKIGLDIYRRELNAQLSKSSSAQGAYSVEISRRQDRQACKETCCARTALCFLLLLGYTEGLTISTLSVKNLLSAPSEKKLAVEDKIFKVLVHHKKSTGATNKAQTGEYFKIRATECEVDSVSSYFFHGLSLILEVPFSKDSAGVHIARVPDVDLERSLPRHLWDVSSLTFSDVERLCLSSAIKFGASSANPPGPRVRTRLVVEGEKTTLMLCSATSASALSALGPDLRPGAVGVAVSLQTSAALQAAEICKAALQLAPISQRFRRLVVLVDAAHIQFESTLAKEVETQLTRHAQEKALSSAADSFIIEVRATDRDAPVLCIRAGAEGAIMEPFYAFQASSAVFSDTSMCSQALTALESSKYKKDAAHIIAFLAAAVRYFDRSSSSRSFFSGTTWPGFGAPESTEEDKKDPDSVNANLEILSKKQASQKFAFSLQNNPNSWATFLPCGCFKEEAWNCIAHGFGENEKQFERVYAEHLAAHRGWYPVIQIQNLKTAPEPVPMVAWLLPPRDAALSTLSRRGYTAKYEGGTLSVELVPSAPEVAAPLPLLCAAEIQAHLASDAKRLLGTTKNPGSTEALVFAKKIVIKQSGRAPASVYKHLVREALAALAAVPVSTDMLEVQESTDAGSLSAPSLFQAVVQQATEKTRHAAHAPRMHTKTLSVVVDTPHELEGIYTKAVSIGPSMVVGAALNINSPTLVVTLRSLINVLAIVDLNGKVIGAGIPELEKVLWKYSPKTNLKTNPTNPKAKALVPHWNLTKIEVTAPHMLATTPNILPSKTNLTFYPDYVPLLDVKGCIGAMNTVQVRNYFIMRDMIKQKFPHWLSPTKHSSNSSNRYAIMDYKPSDTEVWMCDVILHAQVGDLMDHIQECIKFIAQKAPQLTKVVFCVKSLDQAPACIKYIHTLSPSKTLQKWGQLKDHKVQMALCQGVRSTTDSTNPVFLPGVSETINLTYGLAPPVYTYSYVCVSSEILRRQGQEAASAIDAVFKQSYSTAVHTKPYESSALSFSMCAECKSAVAPEEKSVSAAETDLAVAPCHHVFHRACLAKALQKSLACPVCHRTVAKPGGTVLVGKIKTVLILVNMGDDNPLAVVPMQENGQACLFWHIRSA